MDKWTYRQLYRCAVGGNAKARLHWKKAGVDPHEKIETKYSSMVSMQYRQGLEKDVADACKRGLSAVMQSGPPVVAPAPAPAAAAYVVAPARRERHVNCGGASSSSSSIRQPPPMASCGLCRGLVGGGIIGHSPARGAGGGIDHGRDAEDARGEASWWAAA